MSSPFSRQAFTISELTRRIRHGLETQYTNIWVEGEVSNYTRSSLGHAYFTLKDEYSQLKIVVFKTKLRYLKFQPKNGTRLIVHGNITVYEKRGEYQLQGDYYEPRGLGSLQMAFEELKNRLEKEGLFSATLKKPIPFLPRTIGIITSASGAALHDILSVSYRRFPNLHVIINPVTVQGEEAAPQISEAIQELNAIPEVDVIIIARGGGSLEDLWCFNDEKVVRTISASQKPVVSAVGHETDFTIADFVADLRAPTPSAAAELVVKDKSQLTTYLKRLQDNLLTNLRVPVAQRQQQLDDSQRKLSFAFSTFVRQNTEQLQNYYRSLLQNQPAAKLKERKLGKQHLENKAIQAMLSIISQKRGELARLTAGLDALNPLQVLKRGYSICYKLPENKIINEANKLRKNDLMKITMSTGEIISTVRDVKPG